jgi:hypothetical protein
VFDGKFFFGQNGSVIMGTFFCMEKWMRVVFFG